MGSRQKFIGPKPKVVAPKASQEDDWKEVPKGKSVCCRHSMHEYPTIVSAGGKYRYNEKRFEALDVRDGNEVGDMYITAPFYVWISDEEENEEEEDFE